MTLILEVIEQEPAWLAVVPDASARCRRAATAALAAAPLAPRDGTICIVLADDADVRTLNANYRGCDEATDVLSFSYRGGDGEIVAASAEPAPLGDVILALGVCTRDSVAVAKPLGDHLSHLVVHGILHLLGYDHVAEDEAIMMEALETRILAGLGLPDPYAVLPTLDNGISTS